VTQIPFTSYVGLEKLTFPLHIGDAMGVPALRLSPVLPVIGQMLQEVNVIEPLKIGSDYLDSNAFAQVTWTTLKSIPHLAFENNVIVKRFDNGLSCRMRYLESAATSVASLAFNILAAFAFSIASAVTLGKVEAIVSELGKRWRHSALSFAAIGISIAGTFSPSLGARANVAAAAAVIVVMTQSMQANFVTSVASAYQRHSQALQNAVRAGMSDDAGRDFYGRNLAPAFAYLDTHLNEQRVQTLSELLNVTREAHRRLGGTDSLTSLATGIIQQAVT